MPTPAPGWYEVSAIIYKDHTKQEKLGAHHQLVFATQRPPSSLMLGGWGLDDYEDDLDLD